MDGTVSPWKYVIDNANVYRNVYRASRDLEDFLKTALGRAE